MKILKKLFVVVMCVCLSLGLTACGKNETAEVEETNADIYAIYELALAEGETKTYTEWLASIRGKNGQNGLTPFIDETTGHWFIGTVDTGVNAQGPQGIQGLKGDTGSQGLQGEKGEKGDSGEAGATITKIKNSYSGDLEYVYSTYYMSDGTIRYSELEQPKTYTFSTNVNELLENPYNVWAGSVNTRCVLMDEVPTNNVASYPWLHAYLTDQFEEKIEVPKDRLYIYVINLGADLFRVDVNYSETSSYTTSFYTASFDVYVKNSEEFYSYNTQGYYGHYDLGMVPEGTDIFEENTFYYATYASTHETEEDANTYGARTNIYLLFEEINKEDLTIIEHYVTTSYMNYYAAKDGYFRIWACFYNPDTWGIYQAYPTLEDYNSGDVYCLKRSDNFPEINMSVTWADEGFDWDVADSGYAAMRQYRILPSMILNQDEFNYTKTGVYNVKFQIEDQVVEKTIVVYDPMENNFKSAYYSDHDMHVYIAPIADTTAEVSTVMAGLVGKKIDISLFEYDYYGFMYEITASDLAKIDFSQVDFSKVGIYNAYFDLKIDRSKQSNAWVGEFNVPIPILVQPKDIVNNVIVNGIEDYTLENILTYLASQNIEVTEYTPINEATGGILGGERLLIFGDYALPDNYYPYIITYEIEGDVIRFSLCNRIWSETPGEVMTTWGGRINLEFKLDKTTNKFEPIPITDGTILNTYYLGDPNDPEAIRIDEYDNGKAAGYYKGDLAFTADFEKKGDIISCVGFEWKITRQVSEHVFIIDY